VPYSLRMKCRTNPATRPVSPQDPSGGAAAPVPGRAAGVRGVHVPHSYSPPSFLKSQRSETCVCAREVEGGRRNRGREFTRGIGIGKSDGIWSVDESEAWSRRDLERERERDLETDIQRERERESE
jgi:hypothetical protein